MSEAKPPVQELKAPSLEYYAWLEVDGEKVNVYNVQVEGKVVSGWVEAQFGAEVALCYRNEMTRLVDDVAERGYADGKNFESKICRTGDARLSCAKNDPSRLNKLTGTLVSETELRKLMFIPVAYTQPDPSNGTATAAQQIGTISLKVLHGKVGSPYPEDFSEASVELSPVFGSAEEEVKKARRVGFAPKVQVPKITFFKFTEYPGGCAAEFKFYYLGKEELKQKGYMPAPPPVSAVPGSPSSSIEILERSDTEDSASDSELAERIKDQRKRAEQERDQLRELQSQRQAKKRKTKAERGARA